jgi:transposase
VRRAVRITLSLDELARLRQMAHDRGISSRIRTRARILLGAAMGRTNGEIARILEVDASTVSFWRRRFAVQRLDGGLRDAPRTGRPSSAAAEITARVLLTTRNVPPPQGDRWTTRSLGRYLGVNHMRVHRTWKAHGVSEAESLGPDPPRPAPP